MVPIWAGVLIIAVIVIVAIVVWKWWKNSTPTNNKKIDNTENIQLIATSHGSYESQQQEQQEQQEQQQKTVPPMLFAINDQGNLDLTDFNGKILDSNYGSSPKIYINLLDLVSKDVREEVNQGEDQDTMNPGFVSLVGTTKLYEVGGREYIVNFTRLV